MNEDHEPGKCHLCKKETMVRWKNIYWKGSEGLTICMPCELKIIHFIEELNREYHLEKINKIKKEREAK